jgi:enamine deaminase RidA (YjgF/YER057c/UK114 family)
MSITLISSGSSFEKIAGYSRAVVDGEWIFISGTAGFIAGETASDDVVAQTHKSLDIITRTLTEAGADLTHVRSLRVYAARRDDIIPISKVLGEYFGEIRPTNTTIVCGFVNDDIKVEIEVVARKS